MTRKKKAREDCAQCHKSLPIGAGVHRLYCDDCGRENYKKQQKERYKKIRAKNRKGKACMQCKKEFLPEQKKSLALCPECTAKFLERRNNMNCLFCGKHIEQSRRLKLFCGTKCSHPSWYVLRRVYKTRVKS